MKLNEIGTYFCIEVSINDFRAPNCGLLHRKYLRIFSHFILIEIEDYTKNYNLICNSTKKAK